MKRCNRCVLPECTPNIVFDKDGICDHCHTHRKFRYKGESELLKILDSHRRTDSKYDCIVTISGGRDSSFALLKLVKDYHMKVLAVNYENPFTDPQAKANIENAVKALNVDIVRFKLEHKIHERTFQNNIIAWFRKPSASTVNLICIACKTNRWEILRIAKKHNIHFIVTGSNPFEQISFKRELVHASRNDSYYMAITKALYSVLREIFRNPAYFNPICIQTMVKGYLFAVMNTIGPKLFGYNIETVNLFEFIGWNEQEVLSRIKSELGWDYPHKLHSTWRFDCRIGHLRDLMYMKTIGVTEREDLYAKVVREGLTTREDALLRLQKENKIHLDEIQLVFNEVGIEDTTFLGELDDVSIA